MVLGNFTPFRAKHVTAIRFGQSALAEGDMDAVNTSLPNSFVSVNASDLIDLTGSPDTNNPTLSNAFAKDFTMSGNERTSTEEPLLGADTQGSQNTELSYGTNSKMVMEFTCVYRNTEVTAIFNDSTNCCLITLDNGESSTTGELSLLFNNVVMDQVGALVRNSDGLMEQKVKFSIRGGFAGSVIAVTDTNTFRRFRVGLDYAEEIRTA